MTTVKNTETRTITSTDTYGKALLVYDKATSATSQPITVTYLGNTLVFANIQAFNTFYTEVLIGLKNAINSPSGAGAGYVAATAGTAGDDALVS